MGKVGNAVVKRWSSREAIRRTAKPLVHPFVHRPAGQSVGLVIHRSRSDVHSRAKRATAYTRCATRTHHARRSRAGQRPEGRGAGKPALLCSSEFEGARADCIRFAHPPLPHKKPWGPVGLLAQCGHQHCRPIYPLAGRLLVWQW